MDYSKFRQLFGRNGAGSVEHLFHFGFAFFNRNFAFSHNFIQLQIQGFEFYIDIGNERNYFLVLYRSGVDIQVDLVEFGSEHCNSTFDFGFIEYQGNRVAQHN